LRLLLTAGPTREPIDPVRFLSNRSTGAMGVAIAEEALRRGHAVLLVLGPGTVPPPAGARVIPVETALEMRDAVLGRMDECDALICAAAVCDYRAARTSASKIERGSLRTLDLVENPDVAAEAGARRGGRPFAIFALETGEGVERAKRKLAKKNADLCVLNSPEAIGAGEAEFRLVLRSGEVRPLGRIGKPALARALLDALGL
jgi:phosphopantothenoylcysteine decarboxylase/phosphopantothenate--cysteine ligase